MDLYQKNYSLQFEDTRDGLNLMKMLHPKRERQH